MPMTGLGGYDSDFADQIRRMLQLGGAAPGVLPVNAGDGVNPYATAASVGQQPPAPPVAAPPAPPVAAPPPVTAPPPVAPPVAAPPVATPPVQGPPQSPTPWFHSSNTPTMALPSIMSAPLPPARPGSAAPAPAASSPAATSTAAPAASGRPASPNLGYYPPNPRFGTMQSQVGGGRGALSNNPIYTTMNLGNLFGGKPAPPTTTSGAGAGVAKGHTLPPGDDWDVDDQGNVIPKYGSKLPSDPTQTNPTALASAVSKPNWWQKFGRPDMDPNQLASAVRKPNWWQNL